MITGLATDDLARRYLRKNYSLEYVGKVAELPVFRDKTGAYHVGGFKHIYSIITEHSAEISAKLEAWRKGKKAVYYSFATTEDMYSSRRLDFLLDIECIAENNRYEIYRRNVRKHVTRALSSGIKFIVETPSRPHYDLYAKGVRRLGSSPRPYDWFLTIETIVGTKLQCIGAYDGEVLIGVLYFQVTDDYASLLFISSELEYRPRRVDHGLYDRAVVHCIRNVFKYVDFGPAMKWDESHASVKLDFGASTLYFADKKYVSGSEMVKALFKKIKGRISAEVRYVRRSN